MKPPQPRGFSVPAKPLSSQQSGTAAHSGAGWFPFLRLPWRCRPVRAALLLLTTVAIPAAPAAEDATPSLATIRAELAGPVTVLLENGNRQTGEIASWDGETLRLDVSLGAGSAQMSFEADQIQDIAFPGAAYLRVLEDWTREPARAEDALELFRAFYQQRGAFLDFMDAPELGLFVRYIRFALEQDKPLRAVAMIEVLRPHIEDEALLESLDDAILLGFFLGGMREEAEAQARKWIETTHPADGSALGWRILAEIHFRNEAFEEALWTALYPIAFANQMPMEQLDACYGFAIAAADETRQRDLGKRLTREMRERGLRWPTAITLLESYAPEPPAPPEPAPDRPETDPPQDGPPTGDAALQPIQTPSPLDPMQSLPTRIQP